LIAGSAQFCIVSWCPDRRQRNSRTSEGSCTNSTPIAHLELFICKSITSIQPTPPNCIYQQYLSQNFAYSTISNLSRTLSHSHSQLSNNIRRRPLRSLRVLRRSRRLRRRFRRTRGSIAPSICIAIPAPRPTNRELLTIILRSPLSNRHKHRLMITRARHTAHAIIARWQTTGHSSTEQSIPIPGIIDALEERELDWVRRCAGLEAVPEVLNGDVRVSDYLAVAGEILRCRVVCSGGVGEGAGC
jgi:hypothetical protein